MANDIEIRKPVTDVSEIEIRKPVYDIKELQNISISDSNYYDKLKFLYGYDNDTLNSIKNRWTKDNYTVQGDDDSVSSYGTMSLKYQYKPTTNFLSYGDSELGKFASYDELINNILESGNSNGQWDSQIKKAMNSLINNSEYKRTTDINPAAVNQISNMGVVGTSGGGSGGYGTLLAAGAVLLNYLNNKTATGQVFDGDNNINSDWKNKVAWEYWLFLNSLLEGQENPSVGERLAKAGVSILGNIGGGFEYLAESIGNGINNIKNGTNTNVSPTSRASLILKASADLQEQSSQGFSEVGKFFWNTGISIVNNIVNYAMVGLTGLNPLTTKVGGNLVTVLMGAQAAGQGMYSASQKTDNFWKVFALGVANGVAEGLFEKVSIDNLTKNTLVTGLKSFVKNTAKQAAVEGSEEMFTEIANILAEAAILQNESEYAKFLDNYLKEHPEASKNKAMWALVLSCTKQIAEAGAAGAISGGVMAGAGGAARSLTLNQRLQNAQTNYALYGESEARKSLLKLENSGTSTVKNSSLNTLENDLGRLTAKKFGVDKTEAKSSVINNKNYDENRLNATINDFADSKKIDAVIVSGDAESRRQQASAIQKGIQNNNVNLTALESMAKLYKSHGTNTVYVYNENDKSSGNYNPNTKTIEINLASPKNSFGSVTHEQLHYIEETNPEAYAKIKEGVEALKNNDEVIDLGYEVEIDGKKTSKVTGKELWSAAENSYDFSHIDNNNELTAQQKADLKYEETLVRFAEMFLFDRSSNSSKTSVGKNIKSIWGVQELSTLQKLVKLFKSVRAAFNKLGKSESANKTKVDELVASIEEAMQNKRKEATKAKETATKPKAAVAYSSNRDGKSNGTRSSREVEQTRKGSEVVTRKSIDKEAYDTVISLKDDKLFNEFFGNMSFDELNSLIKETLEEQKQIEKELEYDLHTQTTLNKTKAEIRNDYILKLYEQGKLNELITKVVKKNPQMYQYFKNTKMNTKYDSWEKGTDNFVVMFHGTPSKDMYYFDSKKVGTNGSTMGSGFYFTESYDYAKEYGEEGKVIATLLNIEKPLSRTEQNISKDELKKFVRSVVDNNGKGYLAQFGDVNEMGYEALLNSAVSSLIEHSSNDADMVEKIYRDSKIDFDKFHNGLTEVLGYDGVIAWHKSEGTQAITFRSNQAKDIFNFNPTESSDIRYSIEKGNDITHGNPYVQADRNVIKGDNPKIWRKQIVRYINELIRQGENIQIKTVEGDTLTITENTAKKAAYRNKGLNDEKFRNKLIAEAHIDELGKISKSKKNVDGSKQIRPDYNSKHDKYNLATDGWNYRSAYFRNFDGTYYLVWLSVAVDGTVESIYNIGAMNKKIKTLDMGDTSPNATKASSVSNNIISKNSKKSTTNSKNNSDIRYSTDKSLSDIQIAAIKNRGISGNMLLDVEDLAETIGAVGGKITTDGKVILYHATTEAAAKKIRQSGLMIGKEDRLYFSTKKDGEIKGYGDAVVRVRLPIELLELNDIFNNEAHLTISTIPNKPTNIRYSVDKEGVMPDSVETEVLDKFGKTYKWAETGYILKDGTKLDLSGKTQGARGGYRALDHRDIFEDYNIDGTDAMVKFMGRGNIRVMPESPAINLQVEPTDEQYKQIEGLVETLGWKEKEFTVDFDDANGKTIDSLSYKGNVSWRKVLSDIRYYFKEGKVPYQSELSQFRYSTDKDSEGNTLSPQQAEFFKDSKVRDENGNLLVMYHGTNSEEFFVFDKKKAKYYGLYGRGFYFTNSSSRANTYGKTREFYLNIKKPISTTETTITRSQMRKFLNEVADNEDYDIYNYGTNNVDEILNMVYSGKTDFRMLYDVSLTAIGDLVETIDLFNKTNKTNFDGIILDTETVVFNSNQIKNIDNLNPTTDKDIRYSTDKEVKPLTKTDAKNLIVSMERYAYDDKARYGIVSTEGVNSLGDMLYKTALTIEPQYYEQFGYELAWDILDNMHIEDAKVEDAKRSFNVIRKYFHKVDVSSMAKEIEYRFDKKSGKQLIWHKKDGMNVSDVYNELYDEGVVVPDVDGYYDANSGFVLVSNETDAMMALMEYADDLRNEIKEAAHREAIKEFGEERADEIAFEMGESIADWLSDFQKKYATAKIDNATSIANNKAERIVAKAEKESKSIIDKAERKANKTIAQAEKVKEEAEKLVIKLKKQIKDSQSDLYEYKNLVSAKYGVRKALDKLKELSKGKFPNATALANTDFMGLVKSLTSLSRSTEYATPRIRQIIAEYKKWYNKNNVLLTNGSENVDGELAFNGQSGYLYQQTLEDIDLIADMSKARERLNADEMFALKRIILNAYHIFTTYNMVRLGDQRIVATDYAERGVNQLSGLKPNKFVPIAAIAVEPRVVFKEMEGYAKDGIMTKLFDNVTRGETQANASHIEVADKPISQFFKDHKGYEKHYRNDKYKIGEYEIPVGVALSLMMTVKQQAGMDSVLESGFAFNDGKKTVDVKNVSSEDIKKLENQLTDDDKAFMDLTRATLDKLGKIKEERDFDKMGYSNNVEKNYFPLKRNESGVAKSITQNDNPMNPAYFGSSQGWRQSRKQGSTLKLFIGDIQGIVLQHSKEINQYAYLAPAIEAMSRILSTNIGDANHPVSMRKELSRIWDTKPNNNGKATTGFAQYLSKLIKDIYGIKGDNSRVLSKMRGAYSTAVLGFNLKTIMTQFAAYPMAYNFLSAKAMLHAIDFKRGKGFFEEMDKYSKEALVRNYDSGIVRAEGVVDKVGKVANALTIGIQKTDRFNIGMMWVASQYEIEYTTGMKVGTEENKVEAGLLLDKIIRETQGNYTNTERNFIMRKEGLSFLQMFQSDVEKQLSRIVESARTLTFLKQEQKTNGKSEELTQRINEAGKQVAKTVTAVVIANVMIALTGLLAKHIFGKDKDEDEEERWIGFAEDLGGNFVGLIPVLGSVYNFVVNGYDMEHFAYSMLQDVADSGVKLGKVVVKAMKGEEVKDNEISIALRNSILSVSKMFGLPLQNMLNFGVGLTRRFDAESAAKYDSFFYGSKAQKKLQETDNEKEGKAIIKDILKDKGMNTSNEAVNAELYRLKDAGQDGYMPTKIGNTIKYNGKEYILSEAQYNAFSNMYSQSVGKVNNLISTNDYKQLSDEEKAKAVKTVWDAYYSRALANLTNETIVKGSMTKFFDINSYALVQAKVANMESDIVDGKTVNGSKKAKVVAYIQSLKNLTEGQKYFLIAYQGYSLNNIKGIDGTRAIRMARAYINAQSSLSTAEKKALLERCGL